MNAQKKEQYHNIGLLLLRITIGTLIIFHGIANMSSDYAFIKQVLQGYHIPSFVAYGVFVGEIIAPILIIIGEKVRGNDLIIAFNFLVAILLAHSSGIFALNQYSGWAIELQLLYLFGATTLFFTGPGNYALSTDSKWD